MGAGAVLDFYFEEKTFPSTANITQKVVGQTIQGLDGEESDLIKQVYDKIVESSRSEYLRMHPAVRNYTPNISFEDVFDVIETLHSYSGTWRHEHYPFPLVSALVKSDFDYPSVDYYRAMIAIVEKVI